MLKILSKNIDDENTQNESLSDSSEKIFLILAESSRGKKEEKKKF